MKLGVMILNLNNLQYTKDCIGDLLKQDSNEFEILLVDQNSSEVGTPEFLDEISKIIKVVRNSENISVNKMWNHFYNTTDYDYLCFLNNDVRLPKNFISDTIAVFEKEINVGAVVHTTNHESYYKITNLNYVIVEKSVYMQGWDYTMRRTAFNLIPEELRTYCGDDYVYNSMYEIGMDLAYVLSSPIIHYEGQSKKFMSTNGMEDIQMFKFMGFKHYLKLNYDLCQLKPTRNFYNNWMKN